VTSVTKLSSHDLDGALAFVGEAAASGESGPFALPVVEQLLRLVPAERAGYYECGNEDERAEVAVQTAYLEWDWDLARAARPSWPLRDPQSPPSAAVILSDFLDRRAKQRNSWYRDVMRAHGAEHECKLWLPAPVGIARCFFLVRGRGDRDFDERDRSVLTILRPHLAAIRERWERRRRPFGVTDREGEVLALVRQGLTNREIADRLVISPATVRTHLEHIFEKLDVHTRTAAVARAFGPGV